MHTWSEPIYAKFHAAGSTTIITELPHFRDSEFYPLIPYDEVIAVLVPSLVLSGRSRVLQKSTQVRHPFFSGGLI